MNTEQREKDFKEAIAVIIVVTVLIIWLVYVWPLVFGQVDVTQRDVYRNAWSCHVVPN